MEASIDRGAPLALVPGRITKVAIQTGPGELEARLSEGPTGSCTGAQLPFFAAVLGEPPAVQRSIIKDDYMVPLD